MFFLQGFILKPLTWFRYAASASLKVSVDFFELLVLMLMLKFVLTYMFRYSSQNFTEFAFQRKKGRNQRSTGAIGVL